MTSQQYSVLCTDTEVGSQCVCFTARNAATRNDVSVESVRPPSPPRPLFPSIVPPFCCRRPFHSLLCSLPHSRAKAHLKRQREFLYEEDKIPPDDVKTDTHGVVLWSTLPEPARCARWEGESEGRGLVGCANFT